MEISEQKLIEVDSLNTDDVSVAFELIIEQLTIVEEELKKEGVNAFQNSQFSKALKLGESGEALTHFKFQLEELANKWDSDIEFGIKQRVPRHLKPHKKGPKTGLEVSLPNGQIVHENSAADTFIEAIRCIGVEEVFKLGLTINKIPLVSKTKSINNNQKQLDDYFICTHSNTKTKKRQIEKIGELLNKLVTVELLK